MFIPINEYVGMNNGISLYIFIIIFIIIVAVIRLPCIDFIFSLPFSERTNSHATSQNLQLIYTHSVIFKAA